MNKNFIKIYLAGIIILMPFLAYGQVGNHWGEQRPLDYHIEYLDPPGITRVDETGITFIPSGGYSSIYSDEILPEKYFGVYPLYFMGNVLSFKVAIKNNSQRTYRNLVIETYQEFLNIDGNQGVPIGDNNKNTWFIEKLGPGEEIVLSGEFAIPLIGGSGIDQTHLRISHWSTKDREERFDGQFEKGQIILEDFQAGIFCPEK